MQTPLNPKRSPLKAWVWGMAMAFVLTACGGGGGGGSSTSSGGSGGGTGGGSSTSGPVSLTGVAAIGAPLIGATVSVLDSNGADCGSITASMADGAYQLTLTCSSPTLPLLIQASGVDMAGWPVLLHTVVQTAVSGANTSNRANITPFTNAMVAMLMGGEPAAGFSGGKSSASGSAAVRASKWALLGNATAWAATGTFLKGVVKKNLDDAGLTSTNVDMVRLATDNTFRADKRGVDAALESLNFQFSMDSHGNELLFVSNRLLSACDTSPDCITLNKPLGSPEVVVNLVTAKSGLAAATPAVASGAFVYTNGAKGTATTNSTTLKSNVYQFDAMRQALNRNLTVNTTAMDVLSSDMGSLLFPSSPTPPSRGVFGESPNVFTVHDGQNATAIATTLAGYGLSGYQLSSFMVQGCLDYPVTATCSKVRLAALVQDPQNGGAIKGTFEMVAKYSTATSAWYLAGNGRSIPAYIHPVTWKYIGVNGSTSAVTTLSTGQGVQVLITAIDSLTPYRAMVTARGSSFPLYNCGVGAPLCKTYVSPTSGYESGDLVVDQVLPITGGFLGPTAGKQGTLFELSMTYGVSGNSETANNILSEDLPPIVDSRYPVPDTMYASPAAIPTASEIEFGTTISWATWAAANPDLRLTEVRVVIAQANPGAPAKQVFKIYPYAYPSKQLAIPSFASVNIAVPSTPTEYALWMTAVDSQGRRYITKTVVGP